MFSMLSNIIMKHSVLVFLLLVFFCLAVGGLKFHHMNLEHEYRLELLKTAKVADKIEAPEALRKKK